jgi:single-stranded-DNA-specific exonuclease
MTPTFVTRGVFDNGSGKIVGKSNEHLKLKLVQHLGDNRCIEAIGFGFGEYYDKIKDYKSFDICYQVFENNFMNQTFLQLLIKDIQNIKNSF